MSTAPEDGVQVFDERVENAVAVVTFAGELDVADLDWAEQIESCLAAGHVRLVIDLTNVVFIDSSVIRAMVLAFKDVRDKQGWVRAVYTHHLIARVIQICGLADTFPQYATVEAALRATPSRSAGGRAGAEPFNSAPDIETDTEFAIITDPHTGVLS